MEYNNNYNNVNYEVLQVSNINLARLLLECYHKCDNIEYVITNDALNEIVHEGRFYTIIANKGIKENYAIFFNNNNNPFSILKTFLIKARNAYEENILYYHNKINYNFLENTYKALHEKETIHQLVSMMRKI